MYCQSKARYRPANRDFIEICLCGRWNSFYYGTTLGRQFLALQNTSTSFGKKDWPLYKKCFFKRDGVMVGKNLKELGVV